MALTYALSDIFWYIVRGFCSPGTNSFKEAKSKVCTVTLQFSCLKKVSLLTSVRGTPLINSILPVFKTTFSICLTFYLTEMT